MESFISIFGIPLGYIMSFIYKVIGNYGWALIIFVVLTRILIFPLGIRQQKSTAKMAAFQPKLAQLQKQYGKDKARYQEEMMKLYEQEGVNPAGGCLPMLVQMILLFGIIDVIYKPLTHLLHLPSQAIEAATKILGHSVSAPQLSIMSQIQAGSTKFTETFSASAIDQINNFDMNFLGFNLGLIPKEHLWSIIIIIPILSFVSQVVYTLITLKQQKTNGMAAQQQGIMKWMMLLMPLISLWFAFMMPAGIGLYWTISNILMIIQQLLLQKIYPPEKMLAANDKASQRTREKMRKKRERLEQLNKKMSDKGIDIDSKSSPSGTKRTTADSIDAANEKEIAKKRLAAARKRMAQKYGDDYKDE